MKRLLIAVLLPLTLYGHPLQERQQQRRQELQQRLRPNAAQRRPVVEDAVLGFYVNQFQQTVEVPPEAFGKILPFLQQFVHDRFEISQRRVVAMNQLRQAINRNAAEEELKRLVREVDNADSEYQTNQEKFFNNIDPLLSPRQQAKVRLLQTMADNRIRQMLNEVQRNPAAGQRQ